MPTTGLPPDEVRANAAADRLVLRRTAIAVAVAVALAVSVVATGIALGRDSHAGTPIGTVRSFLIATAIDHNGVEGCGYLTVEAQRRLEDAASPHPSCAIAMAQRNLRLGGRTLLDEAAIKVLRYSVQQHGSRARVTIGSDGASLTFGLRRATASELAEFQPPPTGWRIDSGAGGLAGW